ncbi:outer membrane beta-barrel protein [Microbulbifer sp. OS29]|uniref:Outer membrane beta-barrel protein n=1 Tax=Microbulbifer okhotskensis TaxID=2926617 RepID=A0A9X2EPU2_9GAMM|nr:outer membrane beta-barrel protein [Microbulbifer okhotskensis]MCO1336229.1 outer membrane beta-barrel protein [Microbulbifer okhotskensis]
MRSRLAVVLGALIISTNTTAAEYGQQKSLSFHPFVSLNTGYSKLEQTQDYRVIGADEDGNLSEFSYFKLKNSDGEIWNNIAFGADFENYPLELRISYGTIGSGQSDYLEFVEENVLTGTETVVERYEGNQDYDLNILSLTGVLELSRNCSKACLYLLGGVSYGQLDWSLAIDEVIAGESFRKSKRFYKDFFHYGAGFRYAFTDHLRMNTEYIRHNIGEFGDIRVSEGRRVEFDMDDFSLWQAGVSYTF